MYFSGLCNLRHLDPAQSSCSSCLQVYIIVQWWLSSNLLGSDTTNRAKNLAAKFDWASTKPEWQFGMPFNLYRAWWREEDEHYVTGICNVISDLALQSIESRNTGRNYCYTCSLDQAANTSVMHAITCHRKTLAGQGVLHCYDLLNADLDRQKETHRERKLLRLRDHRTRQRSPIIDLLADPTSIKHPCVWASDSEIRSWFNLSISKTQRLLLVGSRCESRGNSPTRAYPCLVQNSSSSAFCCLLCSYRSS